MEPETLYRNLQRHLDRAPVGFPPTESGVEIRILKQLFTPEDAGIALALSAIPEPAATIHKRLKSQYTLDALTEALNGMASKGLIHKLPIKGETCYSKMVFAVGMMERQLKRLTPEFAKDTEDYGFEAFGAAFHSKKTTQMRTVPVNKKIPIERGVLQYEDIRQYVESLHGPFATMDCFCRVANDLLGKKCLQTEMRENCLTFGPAAKMMVEAGMARFITREEMLGLLDAAEREGLVLQPENTKHPMFVCCCCGCCCGVLRMAKRFPRPAEYFSANFYAEVDEQACQTCGTCEARCQMEAISSGEGKTQIDLARCIGCGLCVTTCPSDAMHLKEKETPRVPPDNTRSLYLQLLQERYGPFGMVKLMGRKALGLKV